MATSPRFSFLETNHLAHGTNAEISIQSVIDSSEALAEEAREVLPYSFDECTYEKGYLRQAIWSCIDCNGKGVCYGCSIACHAGESSRVHRLLRSADGQTTSWSSCGRNVISDVIVRQSLCKIAMRKDPLLEDVRSHQRVSHCSWKTKIIDTIIISRGTFADAAVPTIPKPRRKP